MLSKLSEWLFDSAGLTAHGFCLLWEPGLIWTYALSDTTIAIAYFSIPLALIVIARRRSDLFYGPLLWLFAAFILLCGTTHWLDLITLWVPLYGLQGLIKTLTAIVSIFTAVSLWWLLPNFLSLPSSAQLRDANAALLTSREQLMQAQKMEAVGQLTGGIAHDFNNLLQVITGSLTFVERRIAQGRPEDTGRFLAAIRQASETAAKLTNRLLAFSRRQALQPRSIEPDHLVTGMTDLIRQTLGPDIKLIVRLGDGKWAALCDPSQLESALLNLSINARDAMAAGGTLDIATADRSFRADDLSDQDLRPGDYIEISVTDSGTGMAPEILDHVFEPFFTTKPMGEGTGLGLSQVYGFVKQSGGFVRLESRLGKGTTVRLYLPAHTPPAAQRASEAPVVTAPVRTLLPAPSCRRILLVEDQADIRTQIAEAICELGCTVVEAGDGVEALGLLQSREAFDLLITDVGLPGLNGRQLADAARAADPTLPVLLVTGYAGKALDGLILADGMELLRKPFMLADLVDRVRALIVKAGWADDNGPQARSVGSTSA